MLTITEKIPEFDTCEDILGYNRESALFFDIETTGLSPASAAVFLIGAVKRCGSEWQLTQWLAQRPEDEPMLLQAFFDAASSCDTLIHFNGATFDLPFLRERARILNSAGLPASDRADKTSCDTHHSPDENADSNRPGQSVCNSAVFLPAHILNHKNSLDLYQKFRPLKNVLGLPRMNQTTLEQFLGWPRKDRLSGKQLIPLYQKYLASLEPLLGDLLLLHNHDDLLGMTGLLHLCAYSLLFEGQFKTVQAFIVPGEKPCGASNTSCGSKCVHDRIAQEESCDASNTSCAGKRTHDRITQEESCDASNTSYTGKRTQDEMAYPLLGLHLTLGYALPQELNLSLPCSALYGRKGQDASSLTGASSQTGAAPDSDFASYARSCCRLSGSGTQVILLIPGFWGELRHFFPNYRDYYYLPLEDQAVHKSVATFVDPQYRTRATRDNCYIKKSGLFFPQPEEYFSPAFKASYDSRELFFACPDLEHERLTAYAASLLRRF